MREGQREGGVIFATGTAMLGVAYLLFRSVIDDAGVFYDGSNGLLRICLVFMVGSAILISVAGRYLAGKGATSTIFVLAGVAILMHTVVWAGSTQLHADRLSSSDTAGFLAEISMGVTGFLVGVWLLGLGLTLALLESEYDGHLPTDISRGVGVAICVLGIVYMLSGVPPRPWMVAVALAVSGVVMIWRTHSQVPRNSV